MLSVEMLRRKVNKTFRPIILGNAGVAGGEAGGELVRKLIIRVSPPAKLV